MVECSGPCQDWYHTHCLGIKEPSGQWRCPTCEPVSRMKVCTKPIYPTPPNTHTHTQVKELRTALTSLSVDHLNMGKKELKASLVRERRK
jgi:hypothetical protein